VFLATRENDSDRAHAAVDFLVDWAAHEIQDLRELARVKALSARHVELREQERLALATRIHDDLSQNITFIRLALKSLQLQVTAGKFERVAPEIAELVAVSSQIATTVQALSTGLRPTMIESFGPAAAIRLEARLYQEASGVPVDCEIEDLRMSTQASIAAYRIAEHSLSNVARHSHATRVTIRLSRLSGEDILEITDNGGGFDSNAMVASLGLASMTERAEIAAGRLTIVSSPGHGTRIVASFPAGGGRSNHPQDRRAGNA